jgi:alpha-L-rhamnosidase
MSLHTQSIADRAARIFIPCERHAADGNILPGHPAERAAWIWAPKRGPRDTAFLHFQLEFTHFNEGPLRLHVTADHRYQLYLDGALLSCGPDRGDVAHWAVATLDIPLTKGPHALTALVWHIGEDPLSSRMDPKHAVGDDASVNPPMAQMSHRAGFLVAGDGDAPRDILDTGHAPWKVCDLTDAVSMAGPRNLGYHDIGPEFDIDMARWNGALAHAQQAVTVANTPAYNKHGVRSPGWVLESTRLPEQRRVRESVGVIRAVREWRDADAPWREANADDPQAGVSQRLLDAGQPVEIPPGEAIELIWDLRKYECGYPDLRWSGGAGAEIAFAWAESLFEAPQGAHLDADSPRGHRDEINGKRWLGFGDRFTASGADMESPPALWWRSGRYLRLQIRAAQQPLRLERLGILTTGFPFERGFAWQSSDSDWDAIVPLLARGLELNGHELWADCPFYEQMMYVGDNVLHALSNFVGYRDDRLSRRTLELLDWSRAGSRAGLVAERYPAAWRQEACTFAMLYPRMLRNFLWWRDDAAFLHGLLPGLRQLIEALLALRQPSGLLGTVPGWPFVDWVPIWDQGCGPGVREGDSSIVNLHLVHALLSAADVERAIGEEVLAGRAARLAGDLFERIIARYWDPTARLVRDTPDPAAPLSEHAQVLALLSGLLAPDQAAGCMDALLSGRPEAHCTIYFSHYLLEALAKAGESEAFFARLDFWRELPTRGLCSLPEMPDPCRSDCHGWGAHPLFHTFASIAGVRPASPGFRTVAIRPMPGPLDHFKAGMVHPRGKISVEFRRSAKESVFRIQLPDGVAGELHWNGSPHPLTRPANELRVR